MTTSGPNFEPASLGRNAEFSWRRSSRCISGNCVEIAIGVLTGIRDSKQACLGDAQPTIWLESEDFDTLLDEFVGEAEPGANNGVDVVPLGGGDTIVRSRTTGVELRFDSGEVEAFIRGIRAGEFRPALASA